MIPLDIEKSSSTLHIALDCYHSIVETLISVASAGLANHADYLIEFGLVTASF